MNATPRIDRVTAQTAEEFVAYAVVHGAEHDDSFADADELRTFEPALEPAFLARGKPSDAGSAEVVGAASLMLHGYEEEGLGRFRVLHAVKPGTYGLLLDAIVSAAPAHVRHVFAFFLEGVPAIDSLTALGFRPTRHAIVLSRRAGEVQAPQIPEGVRFAPARPETDALAWAQVINAGFAGYPGRYDTTVEQARERLADDHLLPDGALLAWRGEEPVGLTAVGSYDEDGEETAWVDHLVIVPAAQGQGVGRALLRSAIAMAQEAGFPKLELSTGEMNERALKLYASEGFEVVRRLVCLGLDLDK